MNKNRQYGYFQKTCIILLVVVVTFGTVISAAIAQKLSGNMTLLSGTNATSSLQLARMHLLEAINDIKLGKTQLALTQLNLTDQQILSMNSSGTPPHYSPRR